MLCSEGAESSSLDHCQIPPGSLSVPFAAKHLGARWGRLGSFGREAHGRPPRHSRLEHSPDGGAWCTTVHTVAKSRSRLSDSARTDTRGPQEESGWVPDPVHLQNSFHDVSLFSGRSRGWGYVSKHPRRDLEIQMGKKKQSRWRCLSTDEK